MIFLQVLKWGWVQYVSFLLISLYAAARCVVRTYFRKNCVIFGGGGDLVINLNIPGQKTSCLGTKSYQPRPPHPGSSSFQWEQWSLTNCHNKVIELQLISLQIIHFFAPVSPYVNYLGTNVYCYF